jgi:hypothetical protein
MAAPGQTNTVRPVAYLSGALLEVLDEAVGFGDRAIQLGDDLIHLHIDLRHLALDAGDRELP